MKSINALLLSDGYKQVHAEQFPKGLTKLISYMTPRMSRLKEQNEMIFFGLQAFCKTYLIDYFNENFFHRDREDMKQEYTRILNIMLGEGNYGVEKVLELHKLGYLPIEISALPEGTLVPMHVPCLQITNTHPDFAWVVQWVESLLSSEIWKPCIHANVGYVYRQIADKYYDLSVEDNIPHNRAISDFGFRGMSCLQEATKASAAWLLSFTSTATIPAVPYLEEMYNCDSANEPVGYSAVSTEHSVMASNFAIDGDEKTFVKKLLTEVYPSSSFSMVSDTYDYWNLVDNILPELKEEILNHKGKLLIRPDSGDIIDISVNTVEHLWNIFGGTVNSKGYKALNPHIGCIYGDGCTPERVRSIYEILTEKGFAANNIVFGAGSLSFNAVEQDGNLGPYTRDTFSVAIKATYGVVNGKEIPIFKEPKTDTGNFKKSQKGMCRVFEEDGQIKYKDGYLESTMTEEEKTNNMLTPVYRNGEMVKEWTLSEIRNRLHKGKF
jgi:nicotinamide phosphoribosyltransferase